MTNVLVLVGSLRAGSINRQLAEAADQHAPEGITLSTFDGIVDLPFYNEDIDGDTPPAAAVAFRQAVADADAVLLVTPEYNGTIPAVLKNALDWGSRPFGASPLSGKPLAVIGSAFGQYGGVWAHDDARKAAGIAAPVSSRTSRSPSRSPSSASPRRTPVRTPRSSSSSRARCARSPRPPRSPSRPESAAATWSRPSATTSGGAVPAGTVPPVRPLVTTDR